MRRCCEASLELLRRHDCLAVDCRDVILAFDFVLLTVPQFCSRISTPLVRAGSGKIRLDKNSLVGRILSSRPLLHAIIGLY